jgi:two-component system, chemotaxis family, chemotaxis protein CheY
MDTQSENVTPAEAMLAEDLEITQEVIQGLLEMLGAAWVEAEELRAEIKHQKQRQPAGSADAIAVAKPEVRAPAGQGVLIIDDSKLLQLRLTNAVESLGYRVIGTAADGRAGAEMAVSLNPRLIILDHEMPVMNGLNCLRTIRKQGFGAKAIVCSAMITEQLAGEYSKLGVVDILTKPVQINILARAMKQAMGDCPAQTQ